MKFTKLFKRKGISLERLATLVLVDEAGNIAAAAPDNKSMQSLYCQRSLNTSHGWRQKPGHLQRSVEWISHRGIEHKQL